MYREIQPEEELVYRSGLIQHLPTKMLGLQACKIIVQSAHSMQQIVHKHACVSLCKILDYLSLETCRHSMPFRVEIDPKSFTRTEKGHTEVDTVSELMNIEHKALDQLTLVRGMLRACRFQPLTVAIVSRYCYHFLGA